MQLMLLTYTDQDGNELDLFVRARTPLDAAVFWARYYNLDPDNLSEDGDSKALLFSVPEHNGPEGAIPWHAGAGCSREVGRLSAIRIAEALRNAKEPSA